MQGMKRGLTLVTLMMALLGVCYGAAAQVVTTTIQDTIYRADGTPAAGTVVVSWPSFTTAAGQAIAAGNTSVTLGANGALSLVLTPNAGATPAGSYYTAVLHLDDGTTSHQYWVVPVSSTPVPLSIIESQVLPTSVAMQTASRAYVDEKIAQAQVNATSSDSGTTYVPTTGGTMTGPLVLPGDPVTPTQAADKHYVDTNITSVLAGVGQKVSLLPFATQTVTQPAGTQLQVNALNGELYASQYQTNNGGASGDGIANALASQSCGSDCVVVADPSYTSNEPLNTSQIPNGGRVIDLRYGATTVTDVNPIGPSGNSTTESLAQISTNSDANTGVASSGVGSTRLTFSVSNSAFAGGSNQLPENEYPPYGKANYGVSLERGLYYTEGQHVQNQHTINCYAVGDCLEGSWFLTSSGGYRDVADEGAHPFDLQVSEDWNTFQGVCSTGCTTGSTSLLVNATADGGTQGEGRFLIDKNPAKTISNGQLVSGGWNVMMTANFTGTNFPVSVFMQTAAAATSQPKNLAPGTVTIAMVTTGAPAGFAMNTSQLPAQSGVACIADTTDSRFPNFETANYTVVDASHITFTFNKVHATGAVVAVGGLCGYGIEQTVDTMGAVRQVFPVVGSSSPTSISYAGASTAVLGDDNLQSTSGFQNISEQVASIARQGNVVTVTLAGNTPVDVNGLTMTVSGVADASYNGSFQVTSIGPNQLTYNDTGANSTSSGGTVSLLTGGYVLYPMAEVLSVYDANAKQVDGQLTLSANTVAWAPGDAVEIPHYYQQLTAADTEWITQYVPRPTQFSSAGKLYMGQVGPGTRGWQVQNGVPTTNYVGAGGTHELPDDAYVVSGAWNADFEVDAGANALIYAHCNLHGCNRWDSSYNLFLLDSANGMDSLAYSPLAHAAVWGLGGQQFTFAPSGFTANAVNTSTLATTSMTAGYQGRAQLAPGGTAGYSNFTLNGNNQDGSRLGFIGGGTGDPSLYLDVPTGGQFYFRVAGAGPYAVLINGNNGGTVQTNVVQAQQLTGLGAAPGVSVGPAAGSGGNATISGTTLSGVLSITTGTAPSAGSTVSTINWTIPSTTPPQGCSLMPRNAASAVVSGTIFTGAPSTSGWTVNVGASALAANTAYAWSYQCM